MTINNKISIMAIAGIIGITIVGLVAFMEISDLENKVKKQDRTIKEQKEVIESQAKMIIEESYADCDCGWYEDFYYQYAEEVGALE